MLRVVILFPNLLTKSGSDFEPASLTSRCFCHRLIARMAKDPNDAKAWEEFVGYYEKFIHVVLHQMHFKSADFDDAVQEILIKIWQNLPKFELDPDRGQFRTWLSRVIRNRLLDFIKQDKRYKKRVEKATEKYLQEETILPESELEEIQCQYLL